MTAAQRARATHLLRLGLGAGDIAYALGLKRSTIVLFLLKEVPA